MGRDRRTGLPSKLIGCPSGARNTSDSCRKAHCEFVYLPVRDSMASRTIGVAGSNELILALCAELVVILLLLLVLLKLAVFSFAACWTYSSCEPLTV